MLRVHNPPPPHMRVALLFYATYIQKKKHATNSQKNARLILLFSHVPHKEKIVHTTCIQKKGMRPTAKSKNECPNQYLLGERYAATLNPPFSRDAEMAQVSQPLDFFTHIRAPTTVGVMST